MALSSMTGYARGAGEIADQSFVWEARSVNGKGLDLRLRLPSGFEALEVPAREMLGQRLKRGNVAVGLQLARRQGGAALEVDEDLLDALADLCRARGQEPDIAALLAVRGVLREPSEEERASPAEDEGLRTGLLDALADTLDQLCDMRLAEGARIATMLHDRLGEIETLVDEAEALAAARIPATQVRLEEQLTALLQARAPVSEDRLAAELALLAVKGDVREETDRLRAHIEAARTLIEEDGAVGRKLDFLAQEFNREANTLCSKSGDVTLTRVGLALKAAVDQLREQVQNVE
jgi:uncharacterized protein (TIGR00255 family)